MKVFLYYVHAQINKDSITICVVFLHYTLMRDEEQLIIFIIGIFSKLRYTAYRQFVRWCWQLLGKEVRVIIPTCVLLKIRTAFPDDDHNYVGFHEGDSD